MKDNRHSGQTITRLTAHVVWCTKYRYQVLQGDLKVRCRDLLVQICDAEDVRILKGVVSKDHVHMHIEYGPSKALSDLVKRFRGADIAIAPAGVSRVAPKILGQALLGGRLRRMEHGQHHGRSGAAIS